VRIGRLEKSEIISEIPDTWNFLEVCVPPPKLPQEAGNCGQCFKCARQALIFDAMGKLECYKNVFDLERYQKSRSCYWLRMHDVSSDVFAEKILNYTRETNFHLPALARIFGPLIYWKSRIRCGLRQVKRKWIGHRRQLDTPFG